AVSQTSADELATHTVIERARIRVVPNGVDLERATPEAIESVRRALRLERPYVVWVGARQPRKNVGVLLDAWARVAATADLPREPRAARPGAGVAVLVGPVRRRDRRRLPGGARELTPQSSRRHQNGHIRGGLAKSLAAGVTSRGRSTPGGADARPRSWCRVRGRGARGGRPAA